MLTREEIRKCGICNYLAVFGLFVLSGCERTLPASESTDSKPNGNAAIVEPTPEEVAASKAALDEAAQRREASERAQNEVGTLPSDHPPVGETPASSHPNADAGDGSEQKLKYDAPESWRETPPANSMRVAQFEMGADDEEPLELVVTSFPLIGAMGDVDANIDRWRKQFAGGEDDDAGRVVKQEVNGLTVTYFAKTGNYATPMSMGGTGETEADQRMLAAIVPTESLVYFFKMVGDADRVSAHEKEFEQMLKTFRVE